MEGRARLLEFLSWMHVSQVLDALCLFAFPLKESPPLAIVRSLCKDVPPWNNLKPFVHRVCIVAAVGKRCR